MDSQVPLSELREMFSGATYYCVAGIAAAVVVIASLPRRPNLDAFPTVGSSGFLGSWGAGLRFLAKGIDIIQEGYDKHKPAPFKVADIHGWAVMLSSCKHIEELRRAPDDELSSSLAASNQLNTRYMLGDEVHDNTWHVGVFRSWLTRNVGPLFPEIRDEIVTAFDEVLDLRGHEWKSVSALSAMQMVICRTTNRLFVGLPLCRDPDWIDLNIQLTFELAKTGLALGLFPKFIRPLAACFFPTIARSIARGVKHLTPIIEERLEQLKEWGNEWGEKHNDLLSWLMKHAGDPHLTVERLTIRMLFINFAAVHTTSNSFTHVLFYLAANPQYIRQLRGEVEAIIEKEGWSKVALGKMCRVDSFLRECQRLEGVGALTVGRIALKDFMFSDGTFIPKGTRIGIPSRSLHYDEKFYKNADLFEPFRFAEMQEEDPGRMGCQFASTSAEYLAFGHGKHACPGRFFAASEMKLMLAHIITTYDIRLVDDATRPRSSHFGTVVLPDPSAKVLFRRRVD